MHHQNTNTLQKQTNNNQPITPNSLKKYNTIQFNTRKQLITRVMKNKERLTEVSNQLGIKLSTSKFIIKSYKKYGRIFKKKSLNDEKDENSIDLKQIKCQQVMETQLVGKNKPQIVYCPVYIYVPVYIPYQQSMNNIIVEPKEIEVKEQQKKING